MGLGCIVFGYIHTYIHKNSAPGAGFMVRTTSVAWGTGLASVALEPETCVRNGVGAIQLSGHDCFF